VGRDDQGEMNVMGMNAEEYLTTVGVVTIFGGTSALAKNVRANIGNTDVTIDTENTDGSTLSAIIPRDAWNVFNKTATDPNLSWRSSIDLISKTYDLDAKQQAALANAFVKIRGKEIVEDQDYKDWKAENAKSTEQITKKEEEVKAAKAKAQEGMTDEQKAISDYKFMEVGKMQSARDNFYSLVEQNSEAFENNDMTINEEQPDGSVTTTTVEQTATDLADNSKERKAKKLTRGGSRAAKEVAKKQEEKAPAEGEIQFEAPSGITATEETPTESTVTTPIDLSNDQENSRGKTKEIIQKETEYLYNLRSLNNYDENEGISDSVFKEKIKLLEENPIEYFKQASQSYSENSPIRKDYQGFIDTLTKEQKQKLEANARLSEIMPGLGGEQAVAQEIINETAPEGGYSKENPKIIENKNDAIELNQITNNSFEEKISGLYLDRKGKNWEVSLPGSGEVRFKGSLKGAKEYLKNYNLERGAVGFKETAAPTKTVNLDERLSQIQAKTVNLDERLSQIQEEREAIRNDATLSQEERSNKLTELRAESIEIFSEKQKQIDNEIDSKMGRPSTETAPTTTSKNLFDELESINDIKNIKDKQAAKKEFDKTNGNKATKINTNFKAIFDSLSKNNLVKRRC
jgi:hypothetical protein